MNIDIGIEGNAQAENSSDEMNAAGNHFIKSTSTSQRAKILPSFLRNNMIRDVFLKKNADNISNMNLIQHYGAIFEAKKV